MPIYSCSIQYYNNRPPDNIKLDLAIDNELLFPFGLIQWNCHDKFGPPSFVPPSPTPQTKYFENIWIPLEIFEPHSFGSLLCT